MIGNFHISYIELIWCIILSKGFVCTRTGALCEDKRAENVWYCMNKIKMFMILIDADVRWLQHHNALYRIFKSTETVDITSKLDTKSGLFLTDVYNDNKQTDPKISNHINVPWFQTLACWRTGIFEAF